MIMMTFGQVEFEFGTVEFVEFVEFDDIVLFVVFVEF